MSEIELYNLPMNVKAWLSSASVQMMTPAERGGYLHLLMHCFQNDGRLPDDDASLAVLSDLREDWKKGSGAKIRKCFYKQRGGYLRHKRLDSVIHSIKEQSKKCRQAGLASAKARKEKQLQQKPKVNDRSTGVDRTLQPKSNKTPTNKNQIQNQKYCLNTNHTHTTSERPNSNPDASMGLDDLENLLKSLDMELVNAMGRKRAALERLLAERFKPVNGTRTVFADIVHRVVVRAARQRSVTPFDEAMKIARNVFAIQNLENPTGMFVQAAKEKLGYVPRGFQLEAKP